MDTSFYDSRIAETTKDHVFLGMTCEDGEGQSAWVTIFFLLILLLLSLSLNTYLQFHIDNTQ